MADRNVARRLAIAHDEAGIVSRKKPLEFCIEITGQRNAGDDTEHSQHPVMQKAAELRS